MQKTIDIMIKKARNNICVIESDLREFIARNDGMYFKCNREDCRPLSHIFNWTQSFFTGMAYLSFEVTKDLELLKWLNGFYDDYYKKVFETPLDTMHDLGFLYTPYAVALYKLTSDENMKKIGIKAADELAKRFLPNGGYIRAWGRLDNEIPAYVDENTANDHFFTESNGLVIIDCMMNLPLLFWASEVTNNPFYSRVAVEHADTTLKYFVRQDDSVCHAFRFDEITGEALGEENYCGYSKGSHWARGTAWAVYGFAIAYAYTKKDEYLKVAIRLAEKYCSLCDDNGMALWDFRVEKDFRLQGIDTSASAIISCGITEILKFENNSYLQEMRDLMLNTLKNKYFNSDVNVPGMLCESNGNHTYTSFGDYFFMEALINIKYRVERIW